MGVWEDPPDEGAGQVFPAEAWRSCLDPSSTLDPLEPVVLAVDVSWDRSAAHVAACGKRADGRWHVQLVHTTDPAQVVAWLAATTAARPTLGVALQSTGAPVSSLLPDLQRDLTVPVVEITSADIARACGLAFDSVQSGALRHLGQSQIERALSVAETRPLSDGWALDRKRSRLDIAPLVAWVNALWAASTFEESGPPDLFIVT
jgi:hypothetical protein